MSNTQFATYCPEDNKLRLYVGRVPRAEYEELRAEGWTSTPKQDCDFVATWTPDREDTALRYGGGEIDDEDQDPGERAAARAERFAGYLGKRLDEATGHADNYEDGPTVHGYQDPTRAERAAKRHDRQADKALTQWGKAEYWQRRTEGVISHALYKDLPGVRMGRIKTLEAELRKREKENAETLERWQAQWDVVRALVDFTEGKREKLLVFSRDSYGYALHNIAGDEEPTEEQKARAVIASTFGDWRNTGHERELADAAGNGTRPALEIAREWLKDNPTRPEPWESRWVNHLRLRLAYENQMLAGQGGRLEQVEIQPGGKIGGKLILKVNKSRATGRAVSVALLGPSVSGWAYKTTNIPGTEWAEYLFDTERLSPDAYAAPTPESLAELENVKATIKAGRDALKGDAPPLAFVNLTRTDAERLAALWAEKENARRAQFDRKPIEVRELTQAQYSEMSKGSYARAETVFLTGGGFKALNSRHPDFPAVAKVRTLSGCPVIITDKPAKPLPAHVWNDPRPAARAHVAAHMNTLVNAACRSWKDKMTEEETEIFALACKVGLAYSSSLSQFGLTPAGDALRQQLINGEGVTA